MDSDTDYSDAQVPSHVELKAILQLPLELTTMPPIPSHLMPGWFIF